MATRKASQTVEQAPVVETQPVHIVVTDIQSLQAQMKALRDQMKAAKEAMPKRDRLAEVLQRQNHIDAYVPRMLAGRIRARVAAGDTRENAEREVIAFVSNLVAEQLDQEEQDAHDAREQEVTEEQIND